MIDLTEHIALTSGSVQGIRRRPIGSFTRARKALC
jgi:hypothetical protein